MFVFFLICIAMIALALWFILPPLMLKTPSSVAPESRADNVEVYRDQYEELEADRFNGLIGEAQYKEDKEELERRLLEDVATANSSESRPGRSINQKIAYAIAAAVPVIAILFYFGVGNPKALNPQALSAPANETPGTMTQAQIDANVQKLAQRLEQNPNDRSGWTMLARSYMQMERYREAANAYEHLTALSPGDAQTWADYAEALAMANGRNLAGKPLEAATHALELDAKNKQALLLVATAAFEAHDYQKSIDYWQKLLPLLPADSEASRTVTDQISKAKELAAGRPSR